MHLKCIGNGKFLARASDRNIYLILENGETTLWTDTISEPSINSAVDVNNNTYYVITRDGKTIDAYNTDTGELLYSRSFDQYIHSIHVDKNGELTALMTAKQNAVFARLKREGELNNINE